MPSEVDWSGLAELLRYRGLKPTFLVTRRSRDVIPTFLMPLLGIIGLMVAVVVIFYGESQAYVPRFAKTALPYPSSKRLDGQLIYTVGNLESHSLLQDSFLVPQSLMALHAHSEMFGWREHCTTSHVRGHRRHRTASCTCYRGWEPHPQESVGNTRDRSHNPAERVRRCRQLAGSHYASEATINNLTVAKLRLLELPKYTLQFGKSDVIENDEVAISRGYLYIDGAGAKLVPSNGDIRIWYEFTPAVLNGTVIGKLNATAILPYPIKRRTIFARSVRLLLRYVAVQTLGDAVKRIESTDVNNRWKFRIWCFVPIAVCLVLIGSGTVWSFTIWSLGLEMAVVKILDIMSFWRALAVVLSVLGIWGVWMGIGEPEHEKKD